MRSLGPPGYSTEGSGPYAVNPFVSFQKRRGLQRFNLGFAGLKSGIVPLL
jgi:hypothetical protein